MKVLLVYSHTPLYGHLMTTDSLLCPWGKKALTFSRNSTRVLCAFLWRHCTTMTWKYLISRFVEDVNTRQWLSFSFPELRCSLLEFKSKPIRQHLVNWTRWNKRDKIWKRADLLFMWRFHTRRHCRRICLSSLMSSVTLSSIMNMHAYAVVL